MNPQIHPIHPGHKAKPYYMVTFESLADRTRWLIRHDFTFAPIETALARWVSWHNGGDFTHHLEMVPVAVELSTNPLALCLKVYVHSNQGRKVVKDKPQVGRPRHGQKGFLKQPDDPPSREEHFI
jgi:hypothetical protein